MNIIGNLLCCELTDLFDRLVCLARFIDATHEVIIQQNTYDSVHTNVKVDKAHSTATKTLQTSIATQRKIINLFVFAGGKIHGSQHCRVVTVGLHSGVVW